jgi:hypothetical protein
VVILSRAIYLTRARLIDSFLNSIPWIFKHYPLAFPFDPLQKQSLSWENFGALCMLRVRLTIGNVENPFFKRDFGRLKRVGFEAGANLYP